MSKESVYKYIARLKRDMYVDFAHTALNGLLVQGDHDSWDAARFALEAWEYAEHMMSEFDKRFPVPEINDGDV